MCENGAEKRLIYTILYIHIFSVKEATSNGAELRFAQDSGELTLEDGTIVEIEEHGRLYYLTSIGSHENDSVSEVDKVNLSYDINISGEASGHAGHA